MAATIEKTPGKPASIARHDPKVVLALRNFAISMSVFNIIGYIFLGFEQPYVWPFIALATGYTVEILLEVIGARAEGRAPRFKGNGIKGFLEFIYPAHIGSLAVNMLLYVNDQVLVMMFGVIVTVGAKWVLRAPVKGRMRHFMNPSNFGIAVVLLLIPWASIAPPYHFTEHVDTWLDWAIPGIIIIGGTMLNGKLTNRMPLIFAWVAVFALQSIIRGLFFGTSIPGALATMTGVAFILFTNYMVTDPGTSPSKPIHQVMFGGSVALFYGLLVAVHIAYSLFFATAIVCALRGGYHWALHFQNKARVKQQEAERRKAETGPTIGKEVAAA
jgi:enediyne biosynthesis protein E5